MKNAKTLLNELSILLSASAAMVLVAGCSSAFQQPSAPVIIPGVGLHGNVHGGQQPVIGSQIFLYAASTSGYGAASTSLLTTPVFTGTGGNFDITGSYPCTPGQQLYVVSLGGNPGGGTNANNALFAALGDCSNLSASTFISVNEVTTVASAYALSPFMVDYAHVGSSSTNAQGLVRAFNNVNKLVNTATGAAGGPVLPAGASIPEAELYSLADIMAACVNSIGGVAGDGSTCGRLFADVTPSGSTAPTDTIGLALGMAKHPSLNVASLFSYVSSVSPFAPQLPAVPSDWTLSIRYSAAGLNSPSSTTVDGNGNIWVANSGNNTVSVLSQSGTPIAGSPFTGNGLNTPSAVAIDSAGNAWLANKGGSTVSAFTSAGTVVPGSPFSGSGTLSAPSSIAIDAPGNIWIANSGNKTITELNSSGAYIYQSTVQASAPGSIAIDPR